MTTTGRTEMAAVAGPGGVGKSRIVGELTAKIAASSVTRTPIFASGKFDQYSRYLSITTVIDINLQMRLGVWCVGDPFQRL
jgi:predicted ATPase